MQYTWYYWQITKNNRVVLIALYSFRSVPDFLETVKDDFGKIDIRIDSAYFS